MTTLSRQEVAETLRRLSRNPGPVKPAIVRSLIDHVPEFRDELEAIARRLEEPFTFAGPPNCGGSLATLARRVAADAPR